MITGKQYAEGLFSSASDEWETPQDLFDDLNAEFHFTLDAAASDENHKCEKYYTVADDSLKKSWGGCVYDPFMGTGTTAIACINMGLNYMGSEISTRQCEYAEARIEQQKAQLTLFSCEGHL